MNNVFRTELDLHRKFDLKGSTYGRTAGPKPGAAGERAGFEPGRGACCGAHPQRLAAKRPLCSLTPAAIRKDLDLDVAFRCDVKARAR